MLVGKTIGNTFIIEKELGSGAMGTVYLARYIDDDRLIALAKRFKVSLMALQYRLQRI